METASIDKTNDGQKWLLYKLWTGSRGPHVNCDTDSDSVRYGMREIIFAPVLVPPEVGRGVGCCHGGYRTYPASESRYYVEETRSLGIADKKIIT